MRHTFPKFQFHRVGVFFHSGRFIHKNAGFTPVKQIKKGHGILIKIMNISVKIQKIAEFINLLQKLSRLFFHSVGFLGMKIFPKLFRKRLSLFFNLIHSGFQPLIRKQHFTRRINRNAGKLFQGTLA